MKLCIDCKFYAPDHDRKEYRGFDKCISKKVNKPSINPVTGIETPTQWVYCDSNRSLGWLTTRLFGGCGKSGRFFEKKVTP